MMRTSYDPAVDAFYARFAPEGVKIEETKEVAPGVMIDLDASGQLVGVEVLGVAVRSSGTYGTAPLRSAAE
jgi:uncharacterized protein YuzE